VSLRFLAGMHQWLEPSLAFTGNQRPLIPCWKRMREPQSLQLLEDGELDMEAFSGIRETTES
jgi:hypothetical protein